jgi:metal-responsive CopG/Arc/MetJ family transcriptional regulator
MRVVSFKVDDELLEMLEELAKRKRMSKSEIIRTAIRVYLLGENPKKPFVTRRIRIYS